jgi:hypothetical protein
VKRTWIRPVAEVVGIMILFYTNLLMGQYMRTSSATQTRPFWATLAGVATPQNLLIGLVGAIIAFSLVEWANKD